MSYTIVRTLQNWVAVLHPVYCPDLGAFLFWELKLALKRKRCGDIAQFKNSLLLYAVQTVEKMVDIFIRDRALKESIWLLVRYIN
jgi:hypothetical protein